jgi:hypothetical protein
MHPGFPAQDAEGAVADHLEDGFLDAAQRALGVLDGLHAPSAPFDEPRVHALQVRREQRRLVATGAGAQLEDRGPVVERVARNEERHERLLDGLDFRGEAVRFRLRLRRELRIVAALEHLARLGELLLRLPQPRGLLHGLREPVMLAAERDEPRGVLRGLGVGEELFDFGRAPERVLDTIAQVTQHAGCVRIGADAVMAMLSGPPSRGVRPVQFGNSVVTGITAGHVTCIVCLWRSRKNRPNRRARWEPQGNRR